MINEIDVVIIKKYINDLRASISRLEKDVHRRTVYLGECQALTRLTTGQKIYVDTRDVGICSHLMMDGYWEPWIAPVLMQHVKPGMRVVDVGANFGYYTLLMASAVGPSGHVYSVEANPHILSFLRKSISVNGLGEWTTIIDKAAFDKETTLNFSYEAEFSGSGNVFGRSSGPHWNTQGIKVDAVPLDSIINEQVQFIKFDIEGAEEAAMRGMEALIDRSTPLTIIMEFCRPFFASPLSFLENMRARNFQMQMIEPKGVSDALTPEKVIEVAGDRVTNVLFKKV